VKAQNSAGPAIERCEAHSSFDVTARRHDLLMTRAQAFQAERKMKWSVVRTRQRAEPLRTRPHELMEVAIGMMQDVIFWLNKAATYRDPTAHPDADADAPGKDAKYYAQTEYETPLETARKLTNSAICLLRDATFTWDQVSVHEEAAASM
jgi:hypothetical protein